MNTNGQSALRSLVQLGERHIYTDTMKAHFVRKEAVAKIPAKKLYRRPVD